MSFLLHLRQEWEVISKTPFACLICLAIGFAVGSWYYSEQVATLDRQVQFWKDKATATGTATATATVTAAPSSLPPPTANSVTPGSGAHFTMNAAGANFFASPYDPSTTGIVLDVDIRNSGTPSLATGWKLNVLPKGKDPVAARYEPIPKKLDAPGDPPFTVRASESLADKVAKPVPYGKVIAGRLLFYVPLPLSVVEDESTMLNLTVQDIAGNIYSTEARSGNWQHPKGN